MIAVVVYAALYLQRALGFSPLGAGLGLLPATLCFMLVSPAGGTLSDRVGARPPAVAGCALLGAASADIASAVAALLCLRGGGRS